MYAHRRIRPFPLNGLGHGLTDRQLDPFVSDADAIRTLSCVTKVFGGLEHTRSPLKGITFAFYCSSRQQGAASERSEQSAAVIEGPFDSNTRFGPSRPRRSRQTRCVRIVQPSPVVRAPLREPTIASESCADLKAQPPLSFRRNPARKVDSQQSFQHRNSDASSGEWPPRASQVRSRARPAHIVEHQCP